LARLPAPLWHRFFAANGVEPLLVTYEDLRRSPEDATKDVLDFLEIPSAGVPIQVRTGRQANRTNDDWIARYRSETGG
jgi:LPS sulfotransferase NodH